MRTLKELRARKNDCRLKAIQIIEQAEKEDRFLTEEENKELTRLETEMRNWEKQIVRLEVFNGDFEEDKTEKKDNADTKNDSAGEPDETEVVKDNPDKDEERKFRTLGEQMMAVYRASTPAGKIDRRLLTLLK